MESDEREEQRAAELSPDKLAKWRNSQEFKDFMTEHQQFFSTSATLSPPWNPAGLPGPSPAQSLSSSSPSSSSSHYSPGLLSADPVVSPGVDV